MTVRIKRTIMVLVSAVLLGVILISAFGITASAGDKTDYSFYILTSASSGGLNKIQSPSNDSDLSDSNLCAATNAGNAGVYLGYTDPDKLEDVVVNWLTSKISGAAVTYSYDTLSKLEVSGKEKVRLYAWYGKALNQLGLDSVSPDGFNFVRVIAGALISFFYLLASSVGFAFSMAIKLLEFLNPFRLFGSLVDNVTFAHSETNWLASASKTIVKWIKLIQNFALNYIIPIMLLIIVVMFFVVKFTKSGMKAEHRQTHMWGLIRNYVIRLIFIIAGIPLVAGVYTGVLEGLDNYIETAALAPTSAVAMTMVDFREWASKKSLGLPDSDDLPDGFTVHAVHDGRKVYYEPTAKLQANVRSVCEAINNDVDAISGYTASSSRRVNGQNNLTKSRINIYAKDGDSRLVNVSNGNTIASTQDLIIRYMSNEHIYASDFEGAVKASEQDFGTSGSGDDDDNNQNKWQEWFDKAKDPNVWIKDAENNSDTLANSSGTPQKKLVYDGSLDAADYTEGEAKLSYSSGDKGLSALSLYNYLSSNFTDTGVVVYSQENATSNHVKENHCSVNVVGTGFMSVLYVINLIAMLACFAIIGWFYAIGMVMTCIHRGVRVILDIPFATLGFLHSIARVISGVLLLIVEIIASIFLYTVIVNVVTSITTLIDAAYSGIVNGVEDLFTASTVVGHTVVTGDIITFLHPIVVIFETALVIWLCVQALRLRKTVLKVIAEMIDGPVERYLTRPALAAGGMGMGVGKTPGAKPPTGAQSSSSGKGKNGKHSTGNNSQGQNGRPGVDADGNSSETDIGGTSDTTGADGGSGTDMNSHSVLSEEGHPENIGGTGMDGPDMTGGMPGGDGTSDVSNLSSTMDGADTSALTSGDMTGDMAGDMASGGEPGVGLVAGAATEQRYGEANDEAEEYKQGRQALEGQSLDNNNLPNAMPTGVGAPFNDKFDLTDEEKAQKQAAEQYEQERGVRQALGSDSSTFLDNEQYHEDLRETEREAKKHAGEMERLGREQQAVGTAEAVAGVLAGDVSLVKDGVKNVDKGGTTAAYGKHESKTAHTKAVNTAAKGSEARQAQRAQQTAVDNSRIANYGGGGGFSDNSVSNKRQNQQKQLNRNNNKNVANARSNKNVRASNKLQSNNKRVRRPNTQQSRPLQGGQAGQQSRISQNASAQGRNNRQLDRTQRVANRTAANGSYTPPRQRTSQPVRPQQSRSAPPVRSNPTRSTQVSSSPVPTKMPDTTGGKTLPPKNIDSV